jgi:hypothetical protein
MGKLTPGSVPMSRRSFQVGESAEFSAWWKHAGQFVQPIGDLQSDFGLTFARERIAEAADESSEFNRALIRADCLIDDIEGCLRNANLEESQKEIKTFLEHYREQNE